MRILISNDDGYQAIGIEYLAKALSDVAEVTVVAPDRNRSGASNSLTLDYPLRVRKFKKNGYFVNGTPTDCVHIAVTGMLDYKPDMVISGINHGGNLGDDVLYSGTVAAAIEGRFLGLPSVAISLVEPMEHYETAAAVVKRIVNCISCKELPINTILNVNVPSIPLEKLKGFEVTRLGRRHAAQDSIIQTDPRGNKVYWMGLPGEEADAGPGTDFHAVRNNKVSVTPLQLDWTNYEACKLLEEWSKICHIEPLEPVTFPERRK